MAMRVALRVPTGSGVTTQDFLNRGKAVFEVLHAGLDQLAFLNGFQNVLSSKIHVGDKMIELHPAIPKLEQAVLFPASRRRGRRNGPGLLARPDAAEQLVLNEAVEALRTSNRVWKEVGEIMATSPDPAERLRKLELETGIDTRLFRRFHYMKQSEFFAEVDGETFDFKPQVVRTNVAVSDQLNVLATLVAPRSRSTVVRARVDACDKPGREDGLASGGEHEFRLYGLAWWQKAALEAGRGLGLPVNWVAIETLSTCSLKMQPADVQEFRGWMALLEAVTEAFNLKLAELRQSAQVTINAERNAAEIRQTDPMVEAC